MAKPKVSFIVPVYGVEAYLEQCLDSIAAQSLTDWECILVDDGSPDACGEICDAYAAADARFHVIHKENAGVSAARNDGIDASSGTWACFVDSDDWLEPHAALHLLEAAEGAGVDCVMSYAELLAPGKAPRRSAPFTGPFIARGRDEMGEIQKFVLYQRYSSRYNPELQVGYAAPWGKFARLSVIKGNGVRFDPYLNGVFDDGLYSLWLLEYCDSLMYLHEKTYNYRVVQGSLTHSFKANAIETQRRGYERIERFLRTTGKGRDFWEAYYAHVVRFLGGYLSRYYFNAANPKPGAEVLAELRADLASEPFRSAAQYADLSVLAPKDRFLALCERNGWVGGLKLYCAARQAVKG